MGHTLVRIYLHLVWATWKRTAWIDATLEHTIRDRVASQAERLGCPVRAFGASDDHVHMVIEQDRASALVTVVRALKGASGRAANVRLRALGFRWQEGYGAFSVCESDLAAVSEYVSAQRERHGSGAVVAAWECDAFDPSPRG